MDITTITTEAENSVLSACLTDPEAIRFALDIVEPGDFYNPRAEVLFQVMADMHAAGTPVSAVSVAAECRSRQVSISPADLAGLMVSADNAGSVAVHAGIVRDDATRRRVQEIVTRSQQQLNEHSMDVSEILQNMVHDARTVSAGDHSESYRAKPLGEVLAVKDEYEWVIPGLLEKKDRVIITAAEGVGKTTFIRQMAIAAASGVDPFSFRSIRPVRVLVIDSENSERQWRRAVRRLVNVAKRSSGQGDPLVNVHLACIPRTAITRDKELGKIHRMLDDFQPEIVCIGPLYRLAPGSMNSDEDVAPVLAALDTIRDTGAAMIIEGHAGKGKNAADTRDLRPRGSAALLGWPEFGFGITNFSDSKDLHQEGIYSLIRWRGDREERHWPEQLVKGTQWYWEDANTQGLSRFEGAA